MRMRKLSRGRKMVLTLAAFFGLPAAVYDTIGRFHAIESSLPPWATPICQ